VCPLHQEHAEQQHHACSSSTLLVAGPSQHVCLAALLAPSLLPVQAQPRDPESFPFVVLGNKIDVEEGKSRMVRGPACAGCQQRVNQSTAA
jgi:hypothetical protein